MFPLTSCKQLNLAGLEHCKVHAPKRAHWLWFSAEAGGEETKSSGHRTMAARNRPPSLLLLLLLHLHLLLRRLLRPRSNTHTTRATYVVVNGAAVA